MPLRAAYRVLVTPTRSPPPHENHFLLVKPFAFVSCAHQRHLACSFHASCSSSFPHLSSSSFDSSSSPSFMSIPPLRRVTANPCLRSQPRSMRSHLRRNFPSVHSDRLRVANLHFPHFWQLYHTTFSVCFSLLFDLLPFTPCSVTCPFPFILLPLVLFPSILFCPVFPRFPVCSFAYSQIRRLRGGL